MPSGLNPADDGSRGISSGHLMQKSKWLTGPDYLWRQEESWPINPETRDDIPEEFQPIADKKVFAATISYCSITKFMERYSDLSKLMRAVAWLLKYKKVLRKGNVEKTSLKVGDIKDAELEMVKYVQKSTFRSIMEIFF